MIAGLESAEWLALQRAAFLVGPLLAAAALVLACRPAPREAVGAMVAFLWQLPALLLLHLLATHFHWWSFGGERNMLAGLPIDVWIGWAVWWGPVAVFANRWLGIPAIVGMSVLIDLATMPTLSPLVETGPGWFVGDEMTAADIMMSFPVEAAAARAGLGRYPALENWLGRIHARDAYQAALDRGGEYSLLN